MDCDVCSEIETPLGWFCRRSLYEIVSIILTPHIYATHEELLNFLFYASNKIYDWEFITQ